MGLFAKNCHPSPSFARYMAMVPESALPWAALVSSRTNERIRDEQQEAQGNAAFRHLAVRVRGADGLVRGRIAAIFQMMLDMHVSVPIAP